MRTRVQKTVSCRPLIRTYKKQGKMRSIVYIAVYWRCKRSEISLDCEINRKQWDEREKRPKFELVKKYPELKKIYNLIEVTITKIEQAFLFLSEKGGKFSVDDIIACVYGEDVREEQKPKRHGLIQIFKSETENYIKSNNFAYATIIKRRCVQRGFERFIKKYYNKDDYPVELINRDFIKKYELFLTADCKLKTNTLARYIKFLKTIVAYAFANGYITNNPFYGIHYHTETVEHPFLTMSELQVLLSKKFEIKRLEHVRDTFCFCCLTGLAYVDVASLSKNDVFENMGIYWIHKKRQKSKQIFEIALCDVALQIVEKYKNDNDMVNTDKLFPICSNQRMNGYLQEIADICGIKKHLTTHCARRTFATLSQSLGAKLQNIARMMGHTNTIMTQKYATILDVNILEDANKLNGQFKYE